MESTTRMVFVRFIRFLLRTTPNVLLPQSPLDRQLSLAAAVLCTMPFCATQRYSVVEQALCHRRQRSPSYGSFSCERAAPESYEPGTLQRHASLPSIATGHMSPKLSLSI